MDETTRDGLTGILSDEEREKYNQELLLTFASSEARERQKLRELEQRAVGFKNREKKTHESISKGRRAQTDGGRTLLHHLIPPTAELLDRDIEKKAKAGNVGLAMKELHRILSFSDTHTICHIAAVTAIDLVGYGIRPQVKLSRVQKEIGMRVEDDAMFSKIAFVDPKLKENLDKWYLHVPTRTYSSKVGGSKHLLNKKEDVIWVPMSDEEHLKLGAYLLRIVNSIIINPETNDTLFDIVKPAWDAPGVSKKRHKSHSVANYVVYSKSAVPLLDNLQDIADRYYRKPEPMVCFPLEWGLDENGKEIRGGHIFALPGRQSDLIHNNRKAAKSVATPFVYAGVNRSSKNIVEIDGIGLDVLQGYSKTTVSIGSFNSLEKDSFNELYMPVRDPALDDPECDPELLKQYKRDKASAHSKFRLAEQQSEAPRRVLLKAEEYRHEQFCFSNFLDYRGRIYPLGDLHHQTPDWIRSLIISAIKLPITQQTEIDLLIHIANTGAFDGIDKESYEARISWARNYVHSEKVKAFVDNPFSWTLWHDADSPFCHLQACRHFYEMFIYKTKNYCDIFCYSDATCSGLQLISGVQRFTDGCLSTNVMHTSKPGDAYHVVADGTIELLSDPKYMELAFLHREEQTKARNKKLPPDKQIELRGNTFEFDVSQLDRSCTKHALMIFLYSGSYRTIHGSIFDRLKTKKGVDVHLGDRSIITRAVLDTIQSKFKAAVDVNTFIQEVVKLTLDSGKNHVSWISPAGLECVSIAQTPEFKEVRCHAAGGNSYARLEKDEWGSSYLHSGWGDILPKKILSATPANVVHSWDSSTLMGGFLALEPNEPVLTIHDSIGYVAGRSEHVLPHFRRSFYNVITSNLLEGLIECNGLEGQIEPPSKGDAPVEEALTSPYLFC